MGLEQIKKASKEGTSTHHERGEVSRARANKRGDVYPH